MAQTAAAEAAGPAGPAGPEQLIAKARHELAAGAYGDALTTLRHVREQHADAPLLPEALLLAAAVAAAGDDRYGERSLLEETLVASRRLVTTGVLSAVAASRYQVTAARRLALVLEGARDYAAALAGYQRAIELLVTRLPKPPRPGSAAARELSGLRLAAARLAHRHGAGFPGDSERYFDRVAAAELGAADLVTYHALARDLMWRYLPPARLGMDDANVSAIAIDGDDLWVGGWFGGLVRYAQSTGELQVFREPPRSLTAHSVRDVVRIGGHVWVATNQGLSVYARASGRWHDEPPFEDGPAANRVAVVAAAGRAVYVGTLGQGLWRRDAGGWNRIGDHGLPGPFISALRVTGKNLWIGTLDLGLIRLDLDTGTLHSFDEINPDLGPRNVTAIVAGADAALWVATFGSGLFRWQPQSNRVTHYSVESGALPDNWVLAGAAGAAGIYFGTFGGGAVRYTSGPDGTEEWVTIGLGQGMPALDVAVVAAARGQVYFGTLGAGVAILSEARSRYGLALLVGRSEAGGHRQAQRVRWDGPTAVPMAPLLGRSEAGGHRQAQRR